jgi:hypothetical protein
MFSQWTGRGWPCPSPCAGRSERHCGRTGYCQGKRADQQNNSRHLSSPALWGEVARRISGGAVPEVTGN